MTAATDFKKTLDSYRAKQREFRLLQAPDLQYLMVDGHGDPNSAPDFTLAVEALYPVAYALKLVSKRQLGRDYVVPPLEGLWWAEDWASFTARRDKSRWDWTLMLMVPEWIDRAVFSDAAATVGAKKNPARLGDVRLETLSEGLCVQTLHVGSFEDEGPVLAHMHDDVIPSRGLRLAGKHHEIYLSDPRRTAPAKRRTILRQPVEPAPPEPVRPGPHHAFAVGEPPLALSPGEC